MAEHNIPASQEAQFYQKDDGSDARLHTQLSLGSWEFNQLLPFLLPFLEFGQPETFAADCAIMLPANFPRLWNNPTWVGNTPFTCTGAGALIQQGDTIHQPRISPKTSEGIAPWPPHGPTIPQTEQDMVAGNHARLRYRCTVGACRKTFNAKSDWRKHEERVHCKTRAWPCDYAGCIARQTAQDFPATKQLFRHRRQCHKDKDQAKDRLKSVLKNAYPSHLLKVCPRMGLEPCSRNAIIPFKDLAQRQQHLVDEHKDFVYGQW